MANRYTPECWRFQEPVFKRGTIKGGDGFISDGGYITNENLRFLASDKATLGARLAAEQLKKGNDSTKVTRDELELSIRLD